MQELSNRWVSKRGKRAIPAGMLVLFLLVLHNPAWGAWYKDYEDAMEFIEKGKTRRQFLSFRSPSVRKTKKAPTLNFTE